MCRYHQTSPESSFTRQRICTLAVPGGRLTLSDTRLIITLDGRRSERLVSQGEEYDQLLRDLFGICLCSQYFKRIATNGRNFTPLYR